MVGRNKTNWLYD